MTDGDRRMPRFVAATARTASRSSVPPNCSPTKRACWSGGSAAWCEEGGAGKKAPAKKSAAKKVPASKKGGGQKIPGEEIRGKEGAGEKSRGTRSAGLERE